MTNQEKTRGQKLFWLSDVWAVADLLHAGHECVSIRVARESRVEWGFPNFQAARAQFKRGYENRQYSAPLADAKSLVRELKRQANIMTHFLDEPPII